ncbi:phosphoribosyltransferase family protein [Agromyces bauzanensis]|uniref:phosphoribosyltransferase family protein n=1 Tax=Agromyces bauzanensis TaxID=1308924 RepID=UPI001664823A
MQEIVGGVQGRVCLLVDDMIDTGRTIVRAVEVLKTNGAIGVVVAATHAILSDPATEILQRVHRLGRRHRHAPDSGGEAVGPRRLRRRLGHLDVRWCCLGTARGGAPGTARHRAIG